MDEEIQFYEDDFSGLAHIVDNGTLEVTLPTPDDWKCNRKGCQIDYKHGHSTFTCLEK